MNKISIRKDEILDILFYIIYVVFYFFTLIKYGMGSTISNIRYYSLFVFCVLAMLSLILKYRNSIMDKLKYKRLLLVIPLGILLIISSYHRAKLVGFSISMRSFVQTSLTVLPAIYSFYLLNNCNKKTFFFLMKFTTIVAIISYFCESSHSISNFFIISNWTNMTFKNSFLESSICSGTFVQLYLFFKYYYSIEKDTERNKDFRLWKNLTFIFSLICFKRISMLFVIFVCICSKFINLNKSVNKKLFVIIPIFFTILTLLYCQLIKGDLNLLNINVYNFSTGRNYIMKLWSYKNYFSYGYGTSLLVIGRYLEMDLVQVYMEMGLIITFIFIYIYTNMSAKRLYPFLIIIYALFGMLFASNLPSILTWILMFININLLQSEECINNTKKNNERIIK